MSKVLNLDKTIDAIWCKDSETSEMVLVDRETNKEIVRRRLDGTFYVKGE